MFCKAKDGLKFSFGFRPLQSTSSFSTPKFPSIQINKDNKFNPFYSKDNSKGATSSKQLKKSASLTYRQLGGSGVELIRSNKKLKLKINEKRDAFFDENESNFDKNETKSVKSAHLSSDKAVERSEKKQGYFNRNFHSFANILQYKSKSQLGKFSQRIVKNQQKQTTQIETQNKGSLIRSNNKDLLIKPELKETKQVRNNFFQISPMSIEMRQTTKANNSSQKLHTDQKQKSKAFKIYLRKTRPALRLNGRLLNNQRLQNITKDSHQKTHN